MSTCVRKCYRAAGSIKAFTDGMCNKYQREENVKCLAKIRICSRKMMWKRFSGTPWRFGVDMRVKAVTQLGSWNRSITVSDVFQDVGGTVRDTFTEASVLSEKTERTTDRRYFGIRPYGCSFNDFSFVKRQVLRDTDSELAIVTGCCVCSQCESFVNLDAKNNTLASCVQNTHAQSAAWILCFPPM